MARGRQADVFDAGPGRVRRTYRGERSVLVEAAVMRAVRSSGYPVPEVYDAEGPSLVMERIHGPTLAEVLTRAPWRVRWGAGMLRELISGLAVVPRIDDLPEPFGPGERLLHLDLHPQNVLLGQAGPVVVDWENASWGPAGVDLAQTWLILETSEVGAPRPVRPLARVALRLLAREVLASDDPARRWIPAVAARRLAHNLTLQPVEQVRISQLLGPRRRG